MANPEDSDLALVPTEMASGPATQRTEATGTNVVRRIRYLERGTQVGRYLIIDVLGAGGMGVVYSAYDPELDRKIAIKLLQANPAAGSSTSEAAWLLREAQAMARLSHPNVVAVYDVGTLTGDRLFIAMELIEGMTLRAWLAARRSWREVIAVMRAAGAGLAAAHESGLVHRDFKPENVMVGKDGRVRVMDFGLARLGRDDPDPGASWEVALSVEDKSTLGDELTVEGAVIGTPAYMAPEIHTGHVADARTDQFSFGVALYEALYHALPFDRVQLRDGTATPPKPPVDSEVPPRIERTVLRAISLANADRYESMAALLQLLSIDPAVRRRRMLAIAAGVLAVAAVAAVTFSLARRDSQLCMGEQARLTGVWDATTKAAVRRAYMASQLPYAAKAYAALEHALDRYTHAWVTASSESCKATRVRGDQSEEALTLRQACLERQLDEVRALTQILAAEPSAGAIDKGGRIVAELPSPEACSDVEALRFPDRPPANPLAAVFERQLALASADTIALRLLPALVATRKVIDGAAMIGYRSLEAEARLLRGGLLMTAQNSDDAVVDLTAAVRLGITTRREDITARAAFNLATFTAGLAKHPREGRVWLQVGIAAADRRHDPALEFARYTAEGIVDAENGDPVAAAAAHQKMHDVAVRIANDDPYTLLDAELTLAATFVRASAHAKAAALYERVVQKLRDLFGPEFPDLSVALSNLGISYGKLGEIAKARAAFEQSLGVRERLFGKDSLMVVPVLDNFADALEQHGDHAAALALIERAMTIVKPLDRDNTSYHTVATTYGEILAGSGRRREARVMLDELIPIEERSHSPILPLTLTARAELALAERAWQAAAGFAERSVTALEADGGPDNPDLWQPLSDLGRARLELGQRPEARAALERSLALAAKTELPASTLAPTSDMLARSR